MQWQSAVTVGTATVKYVNASKGQGIASIWSATVGRCYGLSRYAVKRHVKSWKCFELCSIGVVQVGYVKRRNAKEKQCSEGQSKGEAQRRAAKKFKGKAKEMRVDIRM